MKIDLASINTRNKIEGHQFIKIKGNSHIGNPKLNVRDTKTEEIGNTFTESNVLEIQETETKFGWHQKQARIKFLLHRKVLETNVEIGKSGGC